MKTSPFRTFVLAAFALLTASILWPICGSCARATASIFGIPLDYLGLAFYFTLGVAAFTPLRHFSMDGIFLGLGFHAFMVSEMFRDHHFCAVCLVVAGLCLAAAILAQRLSRRVVIPAVAIFLGVAGARGLMTSLPTAELAAHPVLQKLLEREQQKPASEGDLVVYVFSRDGCRVCREFWAKVAPSLQADFGAHLQIKKIDPQNHDVPPPTFVVYSSFATPKVIYGLPPLGDLTTFLHSQRY